MGILPSPIIHLENVDAVYQMPTERIASFKEYLIRKLTLKLSYQQLFALNQVDLEVFPGEVFGVIGRNGAGKSTLLKIISRVLPPSGGNIRVSGRVAPLLSLGAGFNPELTGRENIFLNGAIMCFSEKEIQEKYDQIVRFSELEKFINSPLRTYSSGMVARLGFAVATAMDPEILVIDEILSVGDEDFKKKSYQRIEEYKEKGVTILLVSHNLSVINQLCDRVMWLKDGSVKLIGNPTVVIKQYRADFVKQKDTV